MLIDVAIPSSPSVSEMLDTVTPPSVSDVLSSVHQRDLFAEHENKARFGNGDDLARCDLSEEHVHMFPKVGVRVVAVWKRSVRGMTLADIKASDDHIPLFANRVSDIIRQVVGRYPDTGHYCIITTPRRRHKDRNFGCLVAEAIAERIGIPYYEDVAIAKNRQRIGAEFTLGRLPEEPNVIVFDDFVTTGSTLDAMNRLLAPMGKNLLFFVGVDNQ